MSVNVYSAFYGWWGVALSLYRVVSVFNNTQYIILYYYTYLYIIIQFYNSNYSNILQQLFTRFLTTHCVLFELCCALYYVVYTTEWLTNVWQTYAIHIGGSRLKTEQHEGCRWKGHGRTNAKIQTQIRNDSIIHSDYVCWHCQPVERNTSFNNIYGVRLSFCESQSNNNNVSGLAVSF